MRRSRLILALVAVLLLFAVVKTRYRWMPWIAQPLIADEGPGKAEVAVVLAGDWNGKRVLYAADLMRRGYVRQVLVSGPPYYDVHECDIAIQFAVRKGYPAAAFVGLPNSALSTRQEAGIVLGELKRRGIATFLLVTSDYHTARAARLFRSAMRKMGGGPEMRVVAAPDQWFRPDAWWTSREGLKTVFYEWTKTLATALGA